MVKYWDSGRMRKVREQRKLRQQRAYDAANESRRRGRTIGSDPQKNIDLMLDVLGSPVSRRMVLRLKKGGAMSLSKLAKPFGISLPAALRHVRELEGATFIRTHKKGRVRICVYDPKAFKDLLVWLSSN